MINILQGESVCLSKSQAVPTTELTKLYTDKILVNSQLETVLADAEMVMQDSLLYRSLVCSLRPSIVIDLVRAGVDSQDHGPAGL